MTSKFRAATIGLATALFVVASAAPPTFAEAQARPRRHAHTDRGTPGRENKGDPNAGVADAARNGSPARGLYAGAGGIFSPDYQVPDPGTIQLGGQLLGGDFGKAYEDYYHHYYYYKYAYCPIGTSYVIYQRRCVGPGDLFR